MPDPPPDQVSGCLCCVWSSTLLSGLSPSWCPRCLDDFACTNTRSGLSACSEAARFGPISSAISADAQVKVEHRNWWDRVRRFSVRLFYNSRLEGCGHFLFPVPRGSVVNNPVRASVWCLWRTRLASRAERGNREIFRLLVRVPRPSFGSRPPSPHIARYPWRRRLCLADTARRHLSVAPWRPATSATSCASS